MDHLFVIDLSSGCAHSVRMLREELQLLQEPGSYVGEVVKVMGKTKVLVKVGFAFFGNPNFDFASFLALIFLLGNKFEAVINYVLFGILVRR